ncbi:TetR family transcriptional regulator [Burkholderia sp. MSh2]|uniref:TetR family transcriptional regulator n=1 Tax=Burkholderia paludis TaxID=1506587 RepID=A0A6P2R0Z8_9BURK|nr:MULTISPECIES: TetR/AcrR family transcriptional regulator [Burkholderia]KEZ04782.1 TetR family transcriptional regulator [Burkholderia sp. MSh2]KFG94363.1 TetR family transcriptional regulator [Burkholderia paludis]CAB3773511.1 hypothetical protein LMG30113_07189 [Burkholderia paludis]VWC28609.1 TetR family transcriptional regulator [Burkholderia paludis]
MPGPDVPTRRSAAAKRARGRPCGTADSGFDALLRCAQQMFARQGYAATSMREIAGLAGVNQALISHHFGSKEGLWAAVIEQLAGQFDPLFETTRQLRNSRMSAIERIRQALVLFIDTLFETPCVGMLFATAATEHGERLNLLVDRLIRPYRDAFVPLLEDAMDAGTVRHRNPELMYAMVVNSISATVSYKHILAGFSDLTEHPGKFRKSILDIAMELIR